MAFEKQHFRRLGRFFGSGIEISTILLYQIVDIGLNFNWEGSKIKKKHFPDQKISKIVEQSQKIQPNYNYPSFSPRTYWYEHGATHMRGPPMVGSHYGGIPL